MNAEPQYHFDESDLRKRLDAMLLAGQATGLLPKPLTEQYPQRNRAERRRAVKLARRALKRA
ncbi:MAG TPA: hypothetical protein VIU62_03660 [Chloroflexota bacterium]